RKTMAADVRHCQRSLSREVFFCFTRILPRNLVIFRRRDMPIRMIPLIKCRKAMIQTLAGEKNSVFSGQGFPSPIC
ncbi:MAG: hypothetical protein PUJ39_12170, partial [Eubacteriales bacterium]|nr:hypothetical protein [Eubacteriales bacterium]